MPTTGDAQHGDEPHEQSPVPLPPGISRGLEAWLREHLPSVFGPAVPWRAELITGGLSNMTYRLITPEVRVIMRRPPLGGVLSTAHDMDREQRVIDALQHTPVPVPRVLGVCKDPGITGAPFYVMSEVQGQVLRTPGDTATLGPRRCHDLGRALASTLARLHAVDPSEIGLAGFGRAEGYCSRQVVRWGKQWKATGGEDAADMHKLLDGLDTAVRHLPPQRGVVVHGDYRLDNTVVAIPVRGAAEDTTIKGVLDWELSTLGDPLADLGMAMTYWHDRGDSERELVPVARGVTLPAGFPSSDAFAQIYANEAGIDISDLGVYLALGAMKLAVILQGVHARQSAGHAPGAGSDGLSVAVRVLVARGLRQLASAGTSTVTGV